LTGSLSSLTDLGIEFQKDGTLTLNSSDLSAALAADLGSVEELFADDDQGYAFRLDALMDDVLASDGMIDSREDGINSRVNRIQDSIESMGLRLEKVESRLFAQFSAMDSLVANLQSTGTFLTQQMDILNNLAKRN
jgi:flagellar hook-associated protein 2